MNGSSRVTGDYATPSPMKAKQPVIRRIFHACDSCRQRKIRCDGAKPSCEWCSHHNARCTYERKHRKKKKDTEAMRRSQSQGTDNSEVSGPRPILGDRMQEVINPNHLSPNGAGQENDDHEYDSGIEPRTLPLHSPNSADTFFPPLGTDAGIFSIYKGLPFFSPDCQEWVRSCTGEELRMRDFFERQMEDEKSFSTMRMQVQGDLGSLPPRADLDCCVTSFHLTRLSKLFPFFEDGTLPLMIDSLYDRTANADVYCCVFAFIMFVTGYTTATPSNIQCEPYEDKVRLLLPGLLLQRPTVASLQTMLILALCELRRGNMQAMGHFVAIADRMLYVLGGYRPSDSHTRTLFWVCYILDKDLSLRTGRLPVICDYQCDLTLPPAYNEHTIYLHAMEQPFWTDLRLSIIKSKIYNLLYSPRALSATDAELIRIIRDISEDLDKWRMSLPVSHRPAFGEPSEMVRQEIRWMLMHLDFYHCVTMVHQASSRCAQWPESHRHALGVQSSFEICVMASRYSLNHLLKASQFYIHDPNFWVLIFYPLSASINLFCNVLLDPLNPQAVDDLALITRAPASIFQLSSKRLSRKEMAEYHLVVKFIAELNRLANRAIQNKQNEALQNKGT